MFSAAVKRLPSLPPEVVHKVLGDLQLVRILHMMCAHDIPYLDGCVVSHGDIGKVLPGARLSKIKEFFTLYLDIIELHRHVALRRPHIVPLECDAQTFVGRGGTADSVIYHITSAILIKLSQYDSFHGALQPHASGPIPSLYHVDTTDVGSLRHLFEVLNGAEAAMNKKKSEQLKRLAQLMREYPLALKMASDPSQEARPNERHRIDQLERLSERMLRAQILDRRFVAVRHFAGHGLFMVPYDRLLRRFLKMVKRNPVDTPEMARVVQGMRQIYVRAYAPGYPRTEYTPYARERARGQRQPKFYTNYVRHEFREDQERIQPLDERELEWLDGFLRLVSGTE